MVDLPPMNIGALVEFVLLLAGVLGVWFTVRNDIANMKREQAAHAELLKQIVSNQSAAASAIAAQGERIKTVEGHADKVEKIDPLVQRVASFEAHVTQSLDAFREQLRDLAYSFRELTAATLRARSAPT